MQQPIAPKLPDNVLEMMKPLTQEEDEKLCAMYVARGMDEHVWSLVDPDIKSRMGYLFRSPNVDPVETFVLTDIPNKCSTPALTLTKEIRNAWKHYARNPQQSYLCVTKREHWWEGAAAFVMNTDETMLLGCVYSCVKNGDEAALKALSPKRGVGRPRKEVDPADVAYKAAHAEWVEVCKERKARVATLHAEYREAANRAEELRKLWREAEDTAAPLMPLRCA